jgi:hypothetical protein
MKKLYIVVLCIFVAGSVLAQPTLTYLENAPQIGDVSNLQSVSSNGLSHEPVGPDVSWDFSQLNNLTAGQATAIDPSNAPAGNEFPTANIALNLNDSIFTYCLVDETGYYYLGSQMLIAQNSSLKIYTDSRKFMEYPFTYNDTYTDTYKGIVTVEMANVEVRISAISVVTADSYGTLILPTGTFHDVLRTTTVDEEIDSIYYEGAFLSVMLVSRIQYLWHAPSSSTPLFSMEVSNSTGSMDTCCFYSITEAGIHAVENFSVSELNVYPIPASDHLFIEFQSSGNKAVTISIVNQVGQLVISREIPEQKPGLISEKINISALPAGIYFANVSCKSGNQITEKFVKQ